MVCMKMANPSQPTYRFVLKPLSFVETKIKAQNFMNLVEKSVFGNRIRNINIRKYNS